MLATKQCPQHPQTKDASFHLCHKGMQQLHLGGLQTQHHRLLQEGIEIRMQTNSFWICIRAAANACKQRTDCIMSWNFSVCTLTYLPSPVWTCILEAGVEQTIPQAKHCNKLFRQCYWITCKICHCISYNSNRYTWRPGHRSRRHHLHCQQLQEP